MSERVLIAEDVSPRFSKGTRLKHDDARGQWVVLAPERMFVLDDIGAEVMGRVNGETSVGIMVDDLAQQFNAPREEILGDVVALLQDFADKGVLAS